MCGLGSAVAATLGVLFSACGNNAPGDAASDARLWPCPAEWVATAHGGCGPAVILCAPGGGARDHACDDIDITRPRAITDGDGGVGTSFYFVPDAAPSNRIRGGWPSDDWTPDGAAVFADGWAPDAGIPSCAPGWTRRADGTCDPNLRTDCGAGSEPLPGGTCTSTAESDCPSTPYADPGPAAVGATIVHVDAAADPMLADGSMARPFANIAAGIARAGSNGWVLVAAGAYREAVSVSAGSVNVIGQCAAHVSIASTAGTNVVDVSNAGVSLELRGVSLTGGNGGFVYRGARLTLRSVRIDSVVARGITAAGRGTALVVSDVVVARTRAVSGALGRGIEASTGAAVTGTRVLVADNSEIGLLATGAGTSIALADVVVRGTMPTAGGAGGHGVQANSGAAIACTRVLLADNRDVGGSAHGAGTTLALTDAVVRGTLPRGDGASGQGLHATVGGAITCTRMLVTDNHDIGAFADGAGTTLALTDTVVRGTLPLGDGTSGRGVHADTGASVTCTRVIVADNHEVGVLAGGAGTVLGLTDAIVRGTRPRTDGEGGHGVQAHSGAAVTCARVLVADNREAGAVAGGAGTTLSLTDAVVRRTLLNGGGRPGQSIAAQSGAAVTCERVLVTDGHGSGVIALGTDTTLALTDVAIRGSLGRGVEANSGASVTCRRALVADNHDQGVIAVGVGTTLALSESVVRGTMPNGDGTFGHGVEAATGASVTCTRVLVADNYEVGIVAGHSGAIVTLRDVIVDGVRASASRGLGEGVLGVAGGVIDARRLAIQGVTSAAIGTIAQVGATAGNGSSLAATDVFVRGVRSGTIQFDATTAMPTGRAVAYGLYVGDACTISATNVLLDTGGYGFLNVGGRLALHVGVITGQLDAAGARYRAVTPMQLVLDGVSRFGNATSDIVVDDSLPQASVIEPPSAVCVMEPCM